MSITPTHACVSLGDAGLGKDYKASMPITQQACQSSHLCGEMSHFLSTQIHKTEVYKKGKFER